MPDRVVKVTLTAEVAAFKRAMQDAAAETNKNATAAEKYKTAMAEVGKAGMLVGGLLAAGLGVAVAKSAEFDSAMSAVQAATHESAENMDALRQAAIDAGASTVFNATESANAIEELAKAGLSTADILGGGLNGALDAAAASGMGVADAAAVMATTLGQFRLEGNQASHVADLLAAGAGKAMGDVSDLSAALSQSGVVANQFGISVDDTVGTLAAFANAGMLGSDAGTSLRTMLLRLANPTGEAAQKMEELGINAYDAQGRFVGMQGLAGQLEKGLSGLTDAQRNASMAIIFGQDAIRGANVLYTEGAKGIGTWNKQVDETGYAAETARMRLDNLKGDLEALGGAFETALIDTGSEANDTLRMMVQALAGLVDGYNDLPAPVKQATLLIGGATAAVGLGVGVMSKAVPAWNNLKTAVAGAGWSMKGIVSSGALAGLAIGGLIAIVGSMAAAHQKARQQAKEYADTLDDVTHSLTGNTRAAIAAKLTEHDSVLWFEKKSMADNAKTLGIELDTLTDALMGNADAMVTVNKRLNETYDNQLRTGAMSDEAEAAQELRRSISGQVDALKEARTLKGDVAAATREGTKAAGSAAEAYQHQADSVGDLNSELKELIDRINGQNDIAGKAITSNAAYQQALADLKDVVERNGKSLDENTASGSANAATLSDLASKARDAADSQLELDRASMDAKDAVSKYQATLEGQREAFINSATAAGFNADEVKALADRIFQMPTEKEFKALVDLTEAQNKLTYFINSNNGRVIRVKIAADGGSFNYGGREVTPGMASGGPVHGPGPKGVDSELRMLAPGEYVLTADDVDAAGGPTAIDLWREHLRAGTPLTELAARTAENLPEATVEAPKDLKLSAGGDGNVVTVLRATR